MSLSSIGMVIRSKMSIVFAVMVAMVFVLAACSSDSDDGGSGDGTRGGTLRIGTTEDTVTLDPAFLITNPDIWVSKSLYNNIVSWTHELTVQPELALSWEANDDLTSYTFNLREDVKFHSGKDFKAEDVVFSIKRLIDPALESPAKASLDFITDVVALDDHTVRFDLKAPNSLLPEALALYQGRVLPANIDVDSLTNDADGTGPFMMKERVPGERTVLERNPDYWEEGKPYADEVIFFYMPEAQTRLEALKTGSIDIVTPLGASEAAGLEGVDGVKVSQVSSSSYFNLAMEIDEPPFDDVRVRKAIQLATDRDSIQKAAFFGLGTIGGDHPIPPSDPNYNPDAAAPAYDPEAAKALLAEAGHPNGIDLTLNTAPIFGGMVEMAVAFKESAAPAGINVEIKRHSNDGYWATVWLNEPFITVNWYGRNPDGALSIVYKSDAPWNEAHYYSDELDSLILAARAAPTLEEQKEIYGKAQELLNDEVPRIIVFFMPVLLAMRDEVEGVFAHPSNNFILKDGWLNN